MNSLKGYAALVGIDWADRKHDLCIECPDGEGIERLELQHTPEAIDAWASEMGRRFAGQRVAVCIESRKVPLVYALLKYALFVIFPVNPQTLARYRNALRPSHAKDDPTDAELLIDLVARHADQFKPWYPERPEIRALAHLVEKRRVLVSDVVCCTNRLTAALKNYFPQVIDWIEDKDSLLFCDFLACWPNLKSVQRVRDDTLRKFFHAHNTRRTDVVERRIKAIREAMPLTMDPGVIEPNQLWVLALVAQLRDLIRHIRVFDHEIETRFEALDDAPLFTALPGAGPQLAPRLLALFGEDRSRFASAADVCSYTGIAPVTERSGTKTWIHWRYACPKFVRQSLIEWAGQTVRYSFWAGAYYREQRAKGKSHQVAIRALAYKWIRILFRCWQDRKPYDESVYLMALKRKNSPLITELAK